MDTAYDDASRLRIGRDRDRQASTRYKPLPDSGAPCRVANIVTSSGPAAPGFFTVSTQIVTGVETAGSAGILTAAGYNFVAMNLGSVVPPVGTAVLVTFVDMRWVFRYDG